MQLHTTYQKETKKFITKSKDYPKLSATGPTASHSKKSFFIAVRDQERKEGKK